MNPTHTDPTIEDVLARVDSLERELARRRAGPPLLAGVRRVLGARLVRVGLACVLSLTVAGVAHASALDAGAIIYGCYSTANGQLRVVTDGAACRPNEQPIQWNHQGPQGPQGPQGATGPQGPQGLPENGLANVSVETAGPADFPGPPGQVGTTTITIPGAGGSTSHKVLLLGQFIVNKGSNVAVYAGLATDGTLAGPIQQLGAGPSGPTLLSLSHIVTLAPGVHTVSLQGLQEIDPGQSYSSISPLSGVAVTSHTIQAIDLGASS